MEQSLVEQKNYIIELWEENIYQSVQYERALSEVQCLARHLYIQHTIKQIYKAIHKAHDMLEKAEALYQEVTLLERTDSDWWTF